MFFFNFQLWQFALSGRFSFVCQKVLWDNSADSQFLAYSSYMYLSLKILDLFDTVFFILRKKHEHVSFLHVYHHAGVTIGTYVYGIFAPGIQHFLFLLYNCSVCFRIESNFNCLFLDWNFIGIFAVKVSTETSLFVLFNLFHK